MGNEKKPTTARELLAKGWELTEQSLILLGLPFPMKSDFRSIAAKLLM